MFCHFFAKFAKIIFFKSDYYEENYPPILLLAISLLLVCACSHDKNTTSTDHELDSLRIENDRLKKDQADLNSFINVLSVSMDSITLQEDGILKTPNKEGIPSGIASKAQIKQNLHVFEEMLNRQKQKISELEKNLQNKNDARSLQLKSIIRSLNNQIAEKDKMISQLRADLDNKNVSIAKMRSHISTLNENVVALNDKGNELEKALETQSDMMNECYVRFGTKKELQKAGILSGSGLFSKKKLNVANFNPDSFRKVDIRSFHEVKLNSGNPKILSQMPASSYKLQKNEDKTTTLVILDPAKFWSVSNYLVVEY